jgi:predicted transposase/invertase (TIGR01784 family)
MDYCMITQGYYNTGKEDGYKQGEEHGIAIGKEEGIAIGEERAKLEAARNMLEKNQLMLEDISEYTGLSLETVQQLADEMKNKA